jgi:hypothetical protein
MADSAAPIRQITKDEVYDAVPPTDFSQMLEIDRHLNRSTAFDKIISATHDHFWDPLDKKYIDFNDDFDPDTTDFIPDHDDAGADDRLRVEPFRRQAGRSHSLQEPSRPLDHELDPARRAGRAEPFRFALPRAARSRRAGIRRQPNARRGPARHRVREVHHRALGHAAAVRLGAREPAARDRARAGGL